MQLSGNSQKRIGDLIKLFNKIIVHFRDPIDAHPDAGMNIPIGNVLRGIVQFPQAFVFQFFDSGFLRNPIQNALDVGSGAVILFTFIRRVVLDRPVCRNG